MKHELIKQLPKLPGIYIFKRSNGSVIYIGKAKDLQKRVKSYFVKQEDWKIQQLIREYDKVDFIITKNEIEAFLLEAQLISKLKPKYNVLLKNKNPFIYMAITKENLPKLTIVTKKSNSTATFGPFLCKKEVRFLFGYLTRAFRLSLCSAKIEQGCLDYHIGKCAGNCRSNFDINEYKTRLQVVAQLLSGNLSESVKIINDNIKQYNRNLEFEKSKHLSEYLKNLETVFQVIQTKFTENKYKADIASIFNQAQYKAHKPLEGLNEIKNLLKLESTPKTIDCFDISHFQSNYIVGSCIRFTYGLPDKNSFRRFKITSLTDQNDCAALVEIVKRRYKKLSDFPDIILVDGGKGQLNAVKNIFPEITCVSLAKREETLYTSRSDEIKLDIKTNLGALLISLRDYAHHFAISYHKLLRSKNLREKFV